MPRLPRIELDPDWLCMNIIWGQKNRDASDAAEVSGTWRRERGGGGPGLSFPAWCHQITEKIFI